MGTPPSTSRGYAMLPLAPCERLSAGVWRRQHHYWTRQWTGSWTRKEAKGREKTQDKEDDEQLEPTRSAAKKGQMFAQKHGKTPEKVTGRRPSKRIVAEGVKAQKDAYS